MKLTRNIATFLLVGIFLFSGLIKLNDPIGTELKLEEYFEVFALDFPWMTGFWKLLIPHALLFSIGLSSAEIVLAIALALNYKTKATLYSFVGILVFFSFLTFYSAYFNKVTDCGCFGETIKLTPWTSFGKDIFLLILTLSLFLTDKIKQSQQTGKWVFASAILSIGLGTYCYFYLPIQDGLPYSIGENIPVNMKNREELKFTYVYKMNGKTVELAEMPTDPKAEFVSMQAINEKEARPLITDYRLWVDGDTTDYTQKIFQGDHLLVIVPNVHHSRLAAFEEISQLSKTIQIPIWLVSASSDEDVNALRHEYQLAFPALSADSKVLKTIIRSSPGLWLISQGTVKGKWSAYRLPNANDIQQRLKQ
jgi:uncharacterized membrane protein YphA (DoxX/SURF4 family)